MTIESIRDKEFDKFASEGGSIESKARAVLIAGQTAAAVARMLKVDADGHLQVDVLSGGGGGTQYTEGDTDTTITGTALMFEADTGTSTLRTASNTYPLPVADAGGSLTIDGTVAATQSGTWNVGLNVGTNNIGDVDVLSLPSIPAGTNNIGDVDIASALPAGTNVIGAVKRDIVNYTKVRKYVVLTGTTETTIWDPTAGKKFVITDIHISATAAGTCTLRDGTAGSTIFIASLAANGGMVSNLQTPIESTAADNNLTAQASVITQYILICGYEV
ncbi:MAG: hypothetical protein AB1414_01305 [bacterium]